MSVRTTKSAVRAIIDTSIEDHELDRFIILSNSIVTRVSSGQNLPSDLLKDIETWLTAHLIAISKERQPLEERAGDIWLVYQEAPAGFLQASTYGQMVLFLDTSGAFQRTAMKRAWIKAIKQVND